MVANQGSASCPGARSREAGDRTTKVDGYTPYKMPERFNGMDMPESWRLERAHTRQLLRTNTMAVAVKKALDELNSSDAKVMKLKLGITDPEQDDKHTEAHSKKHENKR